MDLFSGCGGFGLGGELAGFHTAVAIDIDPTLQSAYKLNFPNTRAMTADISSMDEDTWRLLLQGTVVDGIIGGPPCQGYSRIGRNDPSDPRRSLLGHFFRTVNLLRPKFFVMENVEGLMDAKNRAELDDAIATLSSDYKVLSPIVVNAADFGAPTIRKRVLVIGFNANSIEPLDLSSFESKFSPATVKDAIYDLGMPLEQTKDKTNFGWAEYGKDVGLSKYAQTMRAMPPKGLGWSHSIAKLSAGLSSGHFDTVHIKAVSSRYANTQPGKVDSISRSKKLAWDGQCPTLRAGTGPDKGSHQAVRPLHPDYGRVITVREAARLQGFPDWFCFHSTKWHSFRMIGNSVSPLVSETILSTIHQKIVNNKAQINA